MKYNIVEYKQKVKIVLEGRLDLCCNNEFLNALDDVCGRNPKEIIFDMKKVSYVDSTCIGKMITFHDKMKSMNCEISITNLNDDLLILFSRIRIDKIIKINNTDADVF